MQIPDTRFSITAISCFLDPEGDEAASFREPVKVATLADAFTALKPSLYIPLPQHLAPEGGISLLFRSMDDMSPAGIIGNTPWLRSLNEHAAPERPVKKGKTNDTDPLSSLLDMVDVPSEGTAPSDVEDEHPSAVSAVLKRIFADRRFICLNGAWRGLALVFDDKINADTSISVMPLSPAYALEQITSLSSCLGENPPDLQIGRAHV